MKKEHWILVCFIIGGLLPIKGGLQYFIGGEAYDNTDLRNYAVIGQILFGLAVICYGFWYSKRATRHIR